jgi:hypothetical protein
MPGSFDDSPETTHPTLPPPQHQRPKRGGNLFTTLSRRLGFDTPDETPSSPTHSELDKFLPPPPPANETKPNPPCTSTGGSGSGKPTDGSRVTSPATIHQNLLNAIKSTRAHDSSTLFAPPHQTQVQEQTSYCDSTPAQNIVFAAEAPRGMRVFLAKDLAVDHRQFIASRVEGIARFEALLRDVGAVYGLSDRALHIFYDEKGGTIAFNSGGSVFCNLRFWEQLHAPSAGAGAGAGAGGEGRVEAATWWWVVVAHELAHNLVGVHGAEHSYYT